jgi:uncharacterized protein YoxC
MAEPPEITQEDLAVIRQLPKLVDDLHQVVSRQGALVDEVSAAMKTAPDRLRDALSPAIIAAMTPVLTNAVTPVREELIKTRMEIMDRIDRLQGTVDLVRDDIKVNWAATNTAFNRNMSTRDDIDGVLQTIAAMERRYQTLMAMVQELRDQSGKTA